MIIFRKRKIYSGFLEQQHNFLKKIGMPVIDKKEESDDNKSSII